VIAVDPSADRRRQAIRLGAAEVVDPSGGDPAAQVKDITAGAGAQAAVETSGASAAADAALASLAPWGRLCAVGLGGVVSIDVRKQMSRQLTVLTSWSLSSVQQIACADFVVRRGLSLDDLFTDRWSLEQAVEAYELFDQQASGKGAFVF
jgi:threonine dehydrogenase-like Zn-dependent dehydrogenase